MLALKEIHDNDVSFILLVSSSNTLLFDQKLSLRAKTKSEKRREVMIMVEILKAEFKEEAAE